MDKLRASPLYPNHPGRCGAVLVRFLRAVAAVFGSFPAFIASIGTELLSIRRAAGDDARIRHQSAAVIAGVVTAFATRLLRHR